MSRFLPSSKLWLVVAAAVVVLIAAPSFAQDRGEGQLITAPPRGITPEEIIQRFAEKEKQYVVRGDYVLNTKNTIVFRYFHVDQSDPFASPKDNLFALRPSSLQPSSNATVSHTFVFGPALLMHTQLTGTHLRSRAFSDTDGLPGLGPR